MFGINAAPLLITELAYPTQASHNDPCYEDATYAGELSGEKSLRCITRCGMGGALQVRVSCISTRFTLTSSSCVGLLFGLQYCFELKLVVAGSNPCASLRPPSTAILDLVGIFELLDCVRTLLNRPSP
jgi:hypothetical protein